MVRTRNLLQIVLVAIFQLSVSAKMVYCGDLDVNFSGLSNENSIRARFVASVKKAYKDACGNNKDWKLMGRVLNQAQIDEINSYSYRNRDLAGEDELDEVFHYNTTSTSVVMKRELEHRRLSCSCECYKCGQAISGICGSSCPCEMTCCEEQGCGVRRLRTEPRDLSACYDEFQGKMETQLAQKGIDDHFKLSNGQFCTFVLDESW